jgi:LCP family protein required for cell wall assembly
MRRHDDPGDQSWTGSGPVPAAKAGRPKPRRRSTSTLILGGLAVMVALVLAGGSLAAYIKYRSVWDGISRINVSSDLHGKRPPADPNAMNILLIGSDTRVGKNGAIGGRSNIAGARSDTVMVLHIAPGAHQIAVISIPRDSVVPILGCTTEDGAPGQTAQPSGNVEQINSTFAYGGPGCLWETIEQTTGIHINDFVELTFVGFEKVIDALHGVEVCLPAAVNDPVSGLDLSAGRHHVYGKEALAFWRTREDVGMGDDPQRIERDQFLMASLLQGIEHSGLLKSPSTMLSVIDTLTSHDYVTTDSGLSPETMLRIGEDLRGISSESVQFVTVPWTNYSGNAQWVDSTEAPAVGNSNWVQWQQPQANDLFSAISHDTKLPKTSKTKVKTVSPDQVAVKVLNGSTTHGIGATTAASLTTRGFDVVGKATNAPSDTYTGSVIEYASSADLPAAETLAKLVSNVTLKQDPNLTSSTLHLILGSTFTSLSSSASSSGSGSAISSLAQTYGGITGNANICSDSGAFAGPDGD